MRTKENSSDRWNFVKKYRYKKTDGIKGTKRKYDIVTPRQLLLDQAYSFSNGGNKSRWGIKDFKEYYLIIEQVYNRRKILHEVRKAFFHRYMYNGFQALMDRIMKEMIVKDGIFIFPSEQAFMFVAEVSPEMPRYKYDILTDSGPVRVMMIINPKFYYLEARIWISLYGKYKEMLEEEIRKGHKYPDYIITVKNIHDDLKKKFFRSKLRISRGDLERHSGEVPAQEDRSVVGGGLVFEDGTGVYL